LIINDWCDNLMLTGPHQTFWLDSGESTTRLSLGERPVLAPDRHESAPVDVSDDVVDSYRSESSMMCAGELLRMRSGRTAWSSVHSDPALMHASPNNTKI